MRKLLSESDLTPEQNAAIDRLYEHDETLLIAKVGFGKCIVALTAAQQLIRDGHLKRVLVLAPLRVCTMTWRDEPAQWDHIESNLVGIACGSPNERGEVIARDPSIVVTNFENAEWMLDNYSSIFDGLIIDEITKLKTPGGAGVKRLRHWVKGLKWRVGMTGTPVAESGVDLYAQALLLDLGKALGTRYAKFQEQYFYPTDYNRHNWEMKPNAPEMLARKLRNLVYTADDAGYWAALPPVKEYTHYVDLTPFGWELYNAMAKHSVCEIMRLGQEPVRVVAESAAVQSGKLCQIAAGGLYDNDGNLVREWEPGHKIAALRKIVQESDDNVVVVYQYSFELQYLRLLYPLAPVLGDGQKVSTDLIRQWTRGEHPVLLMHPKSAAHGLNLQYGGHTLVHLSPIWGADPWAQCLGRLRRRGQPWAHVNRHVLVSRGTIEEEILGRLIAKEEAELSLMAALE